MLLRSVFVSVAALLLAGAAHAQIAEVYATVDFTHVSNIQNGSTQNNTGTTYSYTSFSPVGIGGGVTLNFLPLPIVKLGLDLRGSTKRGDDGADTALAGIKLTVAPPLIKPKFFLEGAVGYLATRTANVSTYTSGSSTVKVGGTFGNDYAIYQAIGGVDYPVFHFIDFRVEAAGGTSFGDGTILGNSNGHAHIFTVNTGLVAHF